MEKNHQKKFNRLKEEEGSVAVLILVTIIAFLIVLTSFFYRSTHVRQAQLETDALLKDVYESQVNDEITLHSWKSYVQEGLLLHYDGINNTGSGHDENKMTWKDLSGNGNDATLHGTNYLEESGWKDTCLKMDGNDDWVDTLLPGNTTITPKEDFSVSVVVDFNTISNQGEPGLAVATNEGDSGLLLGSIDTYAGYGIYWMTNKDDNKTVILGAGARQYIPEGQEANYMFHKTTAVGIDEKVEVTFVYSYTNQKAYMYINGELADEQTTIQAEDWGTTLSNISINKNEKIRGNYATAYADIDVYSARVYTKALTAEEVLQNFKVDTQRFGL